MERNTVIASPKKKERFSDKVIKKVLTDDWIYRQRRSWPLVPFSDFKNCFTKFDSDEGPLCFQPNRERNGRRDFQINKNEEDYINVLYGLFPALPNILTKYEGKLAVCGGSLSRLFFWNFPTEADGAQNNYTDFDCDIFFYNTDVNEAQAILLDCIGIMSAADGRSRQISYNPRTIIYRYEREDEKEDPQFRTIVTHNANVVTLTHFYKVGDEYRNIEYQFILRIYPSLDNIIGGFDLGSCMVAFDGKRIYATPLGAWSIANKFNVVDTTRRSTSYEFRLNKAREQGYGIILPGIKEFDFNIDEKDEKTRIQRVIKFMLENDVVLDVDMDYEQRYNKLAFFRAKRKRLILGNKFDVSSGAYTNIIKRWLPPGWRMNEPQYVAYNLAEEEVLKRYSDYGKFKVFPDTFRFVPGIQSSMLRCNNFSSLFVVREMSQNYDTAVREFQDLLDDPPIATDTEYKKKAMQYLRECINDEPEYSARNIISFLAEQTKEFTRLRLDIQNCRSGALAVNDMIRWLDKITEVMILRMETNRIQGRKLLKGLTWRTENPGAQWTSSYNPIMEDPREFYGKNYQSFKIGLDQEFAETMILIYKTTPWLRMSIPKEIFDLLMQEICLQQE